MFRESTKIDFPEEYSLVSVVQPNRHSFARRNLTRLEARLDHGSIFSYFETDLRANLRLLSAIAVRTRVIECPSHPVLNEIYR